MESVKVLYFVDRLLIGGIQKLIMDWATTFDKNLIQLDFLLLDDGTHYELEETLKKLGCNVYKLKGMWIRKPTDFIKYAKLLDDFFREHHDYKVVHLHSSSKNYMVLKYAKKYNIPIRIAHSHNIDFQSKNPMKKIIGNLLKKSLIKYSTDYFACSELAGKWLFGKDIVNSKMFKIIHNSIDLEKFKYNENIRKKLRDELYIEDDEIVIGHVGRFTNQKNHTFLIDIFNEINKINNRSKLLLVGTGPLENEIKEKVTRLRLEDRVIFLGFKSNINEYMQAMDIFVFPSLYEGLGIVLIEAQASGLKCFTSKDVVPYEANISENLNYISLNDSAVIWANKILENTYNRDCNENIIKNKEYDINYTVKYLQDFYMKEERINEKN